MRTGLLLIIALLLIGAGVYYQNDGQLPSFATQRSATSTVETASSTEPVGFIDRILGFLHSDKKGLTITPDEIPEEENAEETKDTITKSDEPKKPTVNIITPSAPNLSIAEIKEQANEIRDKLSDVSVDVDTLVEQESASPYANQVTFKIGNTKTTDPEAEYLVLTAATNNQTAINISGWKLVGPTGHRSVTIPEGNRSLASVVDRTKAPIMLYPGEQAYLITGENPLKVSFRENLCTGYLANEGNFTPKLGKYCPLPSDELLVYGGDYSDNSKCSDFVSDLARCSEVENDEMEEAEIPGGCEIFVDNFLTYQGCVNKHSGEADYFNEGSWRIYLERNGELWRSANETIQLFDSTDRLIDEISY